MMPNETSSDGGRCLSAVLRAIAEELPEHEQLLGGLDAAIGDGDHGITMTRCCRIIARSLDQTDSLPPAMILEAVGMAITDESGGAIGPLLGTAFSAAGHAVQGASSLAASEIATMLEAATAAVEEIGGARVGDKTLLDALGPAATAARRGASDGADAAVVLAAAAEAAEAGAAATAPLPGGVGKAGRRGDDAIGHVDPGAMSVSLMLRIAATRIGRVGE